MKEPPFRIREANPKDAPQIATIQIKAWQSAYQHIFPADKLSELDQDHITRTERWHANLSNPDHLPAFFVAEIKEQGIVGFSAGGAQLKSDQPYDAELFVIYILPEYQVKGIGRALTAATVEKLRLLGFTSLILWVLSENASARGFYEKLGGRLVGEDDYLRWDQTCHIVAYGWESLDALDFS